MTDILELIDEQAGDDPVARENDVRIAAIQRGHDIGWYLEAGWDAIAQGDMLSGSGWVCRVRSRDQLNEAIEYVAANDTDVGDFIGACNQRKSQLEATA